MNKYNLTIDPYPYQAEGIDFGISRRRLMIGDEPGLGKTLQSIGIVNAANAYPCLVICPAALKINWQREFAKFANREMLILDNANLSTFPYLMGACSGAIVNFESLRKYFVWDIHRTGEFTLSDVVFSDAIRIFRSVIIDECHRVKDPKAQQSIFTRGITKGKPYIIMLSGTPVVNSPADLLAQLSIMERLPDFGGAAQFRADYCPDDELTPPRRTLAQLSDKLFATCLIRRQKADVLPQLPPKTRVDIRVDIANRTEYAVAQASLVEYLRSYTDCTDAEIWRKMCMEALVQFMTLRRLATLGKLPAAIEFIHNFLLSGQKLIVFCAHHEAVDALLTTFPTAVAVTGRQTPVEKQCAIDAFQTSPDVTLIICSIKAAGVGLTLTAASTVAFIELPWTYADCCQCEDRAHRIGQTDNVTCYYLLASATIDVVIHRLINRKKSIAAQIMNATDDIPTDSAYLSELITLFTNENNNENGNNEA